MANKKIKVRLNMAMTMDGHVVQPDGGWSLGSKEDKKRMDKLRKWADALVVARASLEKDNPNLFVRSDYESEHHPRPVVILHNMKNPMKHKLRAFEPPHPAGEFWIPKGHEALLEDRSYLAKGLKTAPSWQTFLYSKVNDVISSLHQRNYSKILLEGGPTLNALFLSANLIDEIFITVIPIIMGGTREDRFIRGLEIPFLSDWQLVSCTPVKNEIFLHYKKYLA